MPFALVAVVLLLSAGWTAALWANLAREDAARELREAKLDALDRVADLVHGEVASHAEVLALAAVATGTDGWVNESRVDEAFRASFRAYLGERFPRFVRSVRVDVEAHDASVHLVSRRMEDVVLLTPTRPDRILGVPVVVPSAGGSAGWGDVDRPVYPAVAGFVNYSLVDEGVTLRLERSLLRVLPVPSALLEAKLAAAARAGFGDLSGVGRTVKAIVATLVQFRVLGGAASAAEPGTTTRDVLTVEDVSFAVNLAILLEEVRLFRTFDREAAAALDAARGSLPPVPDRHGPTAPDRTFARLMERYARGDALDAVDVYALHTGLDVRGLSVAAVLAQAIAGIADDLALRHLDYLGLTPLADWLTTAAEESSDAFDAFLRWLGGRPSRQTEYVHQYVRAVFVDTGIGTSFFGPATVPIPPRAYDVPDGSGSIRIATPAHLATVPFPGKDLLAREFDAFWEAYFPRLRPGADRIHGSLRGLVNDVAARIADDAVLAGLLPTSATGPIDPTDDVTVLDALGTRLGRAVDDAISWLRNQPGAVDALMANLWDAAKAAIGDLVGHLRARYATLVGATDELPRARSSIGAGLDAWASQDPACARLDASQRQWLREMIDADVLASGWAEAAYESRRQEDGRRWDRALAAVGGAPLPQDPDLRAGLREIVVGAGGWLVLARDAVRGLVEETALAQRVAGLRSVVPARLDPFLLRDASGPAEPGTERLVVSHGSPTVHAAEGAPPAEPAVGELHVRIADPSTIPPAPGGGNEHFTRPFENSRRPFATRWTVEVRGAVRLTVATERAVLLGPHGPEPATVEAVWPLDFSFSLHAYSGWNLTGVAYASSATLAADVWALLQRFLDVVWNAVVPIVRVVLDLLRAAIAIVTDLVESLLAYAYRVVELLTEIVAGAADFLHDLAVGAANAIGGIADAFLDALPRNSAATLSAFGLTFRAALNGPEGRELAVAVEAGPWSAHLAFHDLQETGRVPPDGLRYAVVGGWGLVTGPLRVAAGLDPLLAVQPRAVKGIASWERVWRIDLEGPLAEPYFGVGVAFGLGPIPVPPVGTADVEVGVRVHLSRDLVRLVADWIRTSFDEAIAGLAAPPASWDDLGSFAAALARRLASNAVEFLDRHAEDLLEVSLYVEAQLEVGGGPVALGFRLAVAADGRAVRDVLAWLVRNVRALFEQFPGPPAADLAALPRSVSEHTVVRGSQYSRLGIPKFVGRLAPLLPTEVRSAAVIGANVAAFGALFGQDWGRWEVTFGAALSVPLPLPAALGGFGGLGGTLWILRGTLRPP